MALLLLMGRVTVRARTAVVMTVAVSLQAGTATASVRTAAELEVVDARLLGAAVALLPPGRALAAEQGTQQRRVVEGLALEAGRVQRRVDSLAQQVVAPVVGELLPEWESLAGLDGTEHVEDALEDAAVRDAVVVAGGAWYEVPSLEERRAAAATELLFSRGPWSWEDFRRRASSVVLGRELDASGPTPVPVIYPLLEDIDIEQVQPFEVGRSAAGDPLYGSGIWAYYVVTLFSEFEASDPALLAARIAERSRVLFTWLKRRWPPWCGLKVVVTSRPASISVVALRVNVAAE